MTYTQRVLALSERYVFEYKNEVYSFWGFNPWTNLKTVPKVYREDYLAAYLQWTFTEAAFRAYRYSVLSLVPCRRIVQNELYGEAESVGYYENISYNDNDDEPLY